MCYYAGQRVTKAQFIVLKEIEKDIGYFATAALLQSGFDYMNMRVLKPDVPNKDFEPVEMEWGFLPPTWPDREFVEKKRRGYKDEKGKFNPPITTLNAIGEELLQPFKMYRDATLHRRCIVPFAAFYEWRHVHPIGKRGEPLKTAVKYPYSIYPKDQGYFLVAGIWQPWTDKKTGETVDTFAVITTKANPLMEQIHNSKKRMPTILTPDLAYEWMFGDLSEERITEIATHQFPADQMAAHTIRKDFQGALDPLEEFKYENLPELQL